MVTPAAIDSEYFYKRIVESVQVAIIIEDLDMRISEVNEYLCDLTGFTKYELIGRNILEIITPPEYRSGFTQITISEEVAGVHVSETFVLRKNGSPFRGLLKRTPLTDYKHDILGWINTVHDVTEQTKELNAIRESDERLRFLMQSTSEGIIIHENAIIIDVNDAVLKMFGYSYHELVGKPVYQFTTQKDHETMRDLFRQRLLFHGEREIIGREGKIHFTEINSKSVIYKGRDLRVLTIKDTSEQREQKIEEQRLSSIIDVSPFLVVMMDRQGLRYMNSFGRKMLGYGADEDVTHLGVKELMSPASAEMILAIGRPSAELNGLWEGQTTFKKRDGSEIITTQIIIAHRSERGKVNFYSSLATDISDRIKAEQVLLDSQERLKYFMEESLEAIIIHEQDLIIDFNTAAYKMFGYDENELHNATIKSLFDKTFQNNKKDFAAHNESFVDEWIGVTKDGRRFDVQVYSRRHIYQRKNVWVVSILDITASKNIERALRSSQIMLNAAVEGTNVGIWEWNLITDEMIFSDTWQKLRGLSSDQVPKSFEEWKKTVYPDDLPSLLEDLKNHLYGLSPMYHHIHRVHGPSGKLMAIESKGKLVRDKNNLPERIVGTMIDITDRQNMEDELRKSQAQLAALIENREETIWSVDSEMLLANCNKQFSEVYQNMFGIDLKIGDVITTGLNDEMKRQWITRYNVCMLGESLKFVEPFTIKGNEVFVEFTANPICINGNNIIGVSVLGRNITPQIQFEKSLKEAKEFAEEANRTKSQFLANISHEIRTPMNGIIGFTDLLLQSKVNVRQKEYLEIVRYSGESLLNLINDLLDISKIESGKLELMRSGFDLRKLLFEIVRSFKTGALQRQLKISAVVNKDIPKILIGDEMRLQQIFVNLIGNAVKFSEHGEITASVVIKETCKDYLVLLAEVKDEGIGISEDKYETIFEPFSQVSDPLTTKYRGTGLGLPIAKRLVEVMKGEIGVESEPGKGSNFHFTFRLQLPS